VTSWGRPPRGRAPRGRARPHRWVGDKRSQVVYDVDNIDDPSLIDELMEAETYLGFGPDELKEARNRGYKPYKGNGSGVETGE
jgi:hypothetical protein